MCNSRCDDVFNFFSRVRRPSRSFVRGPVAATINAEPIVDWEGGVFTDDSHSQTTNHIVSIVGWGTCPKTGSKHWIIRNSWGQCK